MGGYRIKYFGKGPPRRGVGNRTEGERERAASFKQKNVSAFIAGKEVSDAETDKTD